MTGEVFLIVGATASGKSTIVRNMHERHGIHVLPTYRDRKPRSGENSDFANRFISPARFRTLAKQQFFDHVEVFRNTQYGFKNEHAPTGAIASMSPSGAIELRNKFGFHIIRLLCDLESISERIRNRQTAGMDGMSERLARIRTEVDEIDSLNADFSVSTNQTLAVTSQELARFIFEKIHARNLKMNSN